MAWYHKFLGQSAPTETAKSPADDAITRAVRKAVAAQRDELRVQVLTDVRGQMNHVFEVVDDLKGQIKGLVENKLQMSERLMAFEATLKDALQLVQRVNATVLESTARNARGFSDVNQRITDLVEHGAVAPIPRPDQNNRPTMTSAMTEVIAGSALARSSP